MVGTIDLKTLRYNVVEGRDIALESVAPVVVQTSITTAIYQTTLQDNVALKNKRNRAAVEIRNLPK